MVKFCILEGKQPEQQVEVRINMTNTGNVGNNFVLFIHSINKYLLNGPYTRQYSKC